MFTCQSIRVISVWSGSIQRGSCGYDSVSFPFVARPKPSTIQPVFKTSFRLFSPSEQTEAIKPDEQGWWLVTSKWHSSTNATREVTLLFFIYVVYLSFLFLSFFFSVFLWIFHFFLLKYQSLASLIFCTQHTFGQCSALFVDVTLK